MSRAVYSKCFVAINTVVGPTVYTVPTGDTAILHNMSLWLPSGTTQYFAPVVEVTLDSVDVVVWDVNGQNVRGGVYQWTGREVFTEYLSVKGWIFGFSFRANGYLLTAT